MSDGLFLSKLTRSVLCGSVPLLQDHFSNNAFLEVRVKGLGIRVIIGEKLGFYAISRVWEKWSWRREVGYNRFILLPRHLVTLQLNLLQLTLPWEIIMKFRGCLLR